MTQYETAKQELEKLESESRSLKSNLGAAVETGDREEITRLKGREKDLPNELFSARILLMKAQIEELESRQTLNFQRLSEAKQDVRDFDLQVLPQAQIYRQEAVRLNEVSMAKLSYVKVVEKEIQHTGFLISEARKKLDNLLN